MKKRISILVMIAVMFFVCLGHVSASVGDNFNSGDLKYKVLTESGSTGTVEVTGLVSPKAEINIPATVTNAGVDYTVTGVANMAFMQAGLTKVTFPNTLKSIGRYAFLDNNLTSLVLPDSVTSIAMMAFQNNQIESLTLSSGLTVIEQEVFKSNKIKNLVIPDNIAEIKLGAFGYNAMENVTFGQGLKKVGESAFADNSLTSIDLVNVENIGESAFASNDISSIIVPETLTNIDSYAFSHNGLKSVYLPSKAKVTLFDDASVLYNASLKTATPGITNLYAPEVVAEYKDDSDITKYVGETFEIEVNTKTVYKQVERYDDAQKQNIGADDDAATQSCNIVLSAAYQWHKDGTAVSGETSTIYSEKAAKVGEYNYSVAVNDSALTDVKVSVIEKKVAPPVEPPPVEPPDIKPTKTGDSSTPIGMIVGLMLTAVAFAGFGVFKFKKN